MTIPCCFFWHLLQGPYEPMDLIEAIKTRKSIRAYLPKPVSKEILQEILALSCQAPSGVNQQPWEFAIASGHVLEEITKRNIELLTAGAPQQRDYPSHDKPKDSVYRKRQVALAVQLYQALDIQRDDVRGRFDWLLQGAAFFGAPAAVIIYTDKALPEAGPLIDIGAVVQTLCLGALPYGLGTCIQNQGVQYSDMLRQVLNISENKRIVTSISIGYPDFSHPANQIKTGREPVEKLSSWYGF
ncbi:MAG: nitroreductase [Desulfobacteraceae bacterium]|nr:nitroreductase [Desulfobacteraceae bacterium]